MIGDRRNYLTALIGIEFDTVGDWAQRRGIPYTTYRDLTEKPEVLELIQKEVDGPTASFARSRASEVLHDPQGARPRGRRADRHPEAQAQRHGEACSPTSSSRCTDAPAAPHAVTGGTMTAVVLAQAAPNEALEKFLGMPGQRPRRSAPSMPCSPWASSSSSRRPRWSTSPTAHWPRLGAFLVAAFAVTLNIPGRWMPGAPEWVQWALSALFAIARFGAGGHGCWNGSSSGR